jgi:glycosyltransferase involved in cell wall biosynthesis
MAYRMTGRLRVFVTADPDLPVPPRHYGGIERIIALLVAGLSERGHEVTLFAHHESRVDCQLVAYRGRSSASAVDTVVNAAQVSSAVLRDQPDIVQSFGRLGYLLPVLPFGPLTVMSYQRAITPRSVWLGNLLGRNRIAWTGCSAHLIDRVKSAGRWTVIHNAIDPSVYRHAPAVPADAPLVFLGRIEWIKGAHLAIEVARRSRRRLIIAGNVPDDSMHGKYFQTEVERWVDGDQVVYAGPVDDRAKSDLLAGAAALLMPVQWDEPFGIVMVESLACGTPVLGLCRGAVSEVIEDGITGFVCDDVDGMVAAVRKVSTLDRDRCRQAVIDRFSATTLVNAYESLYSELLAERRLPDGPAVVPRRL